jgi:group I intron endonuclease
MPKTGIYKITSPSGKIYIGQSIDIEKRWEWYKKIRCKSQIKLYNSLKKHGVNSHTFEIIEECNKNKMDEREIYWGNQYNVLNSGLNLRLGNGKGCLSEETKQKISSNSKGISRNKGIPKSKEHKIKLSEAINNRIYTPKRLENMRLGMIGKNTKKIICITNNTIFNSIREASILLNMNERSISNNLLGYTTKTKNKLNFKYI